MGLFDSVLGSFLGNNPGAGPLQSVLGSVLSGSSTGQQQGQSSGLGSLVNSFEQAGLGHVVSSWIGTGPNQPVSPDQLQHVFGNDQIQRWSQQSGMSAPSLLGQLAQFLPQAVDHITPNGHVPPSSESGRDAGSSPFDDAGTQFPGNRQA